MTEDELDEQFSISLEALRQLEAEKASSKFAKLSFFDARYESKNLNYIGYEEWY